MTKPNWKAITQYKCGCEIREVRLPTGLHYSMEWCPKHDVAESMYDALKEIIELEFADPDPEVLDDALQKGVQVLEKAGDKPKREGK